MNIKTGNPSSESASNSASFTRFILPFKYSFTKKGEDSPLVWKRVKQECLEDIIWRRQYFTSEVADVLFNRAEYYKLHENLENHSEEQKKEETFFSSSFQIKRNSKLININTNPPMLVLFQKDSKSTTLNTGFLILEIYFPENQISLDDLLFVNEHLRYKEAIYEGHSEKISKLFPDLSKLFPKTETKVPSHYFDYWHYLLGKKVEGKDFLIEKEESRQSQRPEAAAHEWDIYADSRTFVWSCAVLLKGAKDLQTFPTKNLSSEKWEAHNYGHWIKLLNVDGPKENEQDTHSCVREFEREWAKERTYHRWEQDQKPPNLPNNYYGFSYHSGAAIVSDNSDPSFCKHWQTMYFDMILLLFYLRITLFRFSRELSEISSEALGESNIEDQIHIWNEEFDNLRWEFTLFTNLYQYPLISNQQQGLEMYELARKSLDVNELFKEIQEEIVNGQDFVKQRIEKRQSEVSSQLTRIATIGLAFSTIIAFLSLGFGDNIQNRIKELWIVKVLTQPDNHEVLYSNNWLVIILLALVLILLFFLLEKLWKHQINWVYQLIYKMTFRRIETWWQNTKQKRRNEKRKKNKQNE